jgi:hypothetical protein
MKTFVYQARGEIKAKTEKEAIEKLYDLYDDFIASCVIIKEKEKRSQRRAKDP